MEGRAVAGKNLEGVADGWTATRVTAEQRKVPPIKWWALLGGLILAFVLYVWIKWVTGPNFETVPTGPSDAPVWMATVLDVWQVGGIFGMLFCLYWCVVRPWRRERRVTTDGLLVLSFMTLWFQDPLSSYFGHWFTYNTNLINFGSWVQDVPGWLSFGAPGATIAEPIVLIGPLYVYFILIGAVLGCAAMRLAKARWPGLRPLHLVGICAVTMALFDLVMEGLVWLPLGFWEYPGGYGLLFPSTYHKFPLNELLTITAMFTAIACLRYFRDDKGYTFVERGVDKLRTTSARKTGLRFLAVLAAVHVALFVFYNLPNAWVGTHSREWPADLQERSYLTNGICGEGTEHACPAPGLPLYRGDGGGSPHFDPNGRLVTPAGFEPPKLVPFDRGKPGGGE